MRPRWLMLPLLLGAASAAAALAATTGATGNSSCATGSWPPGTRVVSVPPSASARVSFASGRWRLWLRPARSRALTGIVSADSDLRSVQATPALRLRLHRADRRLAFLLPGGSALARLSFLARCAHRITFDLGGARVLIGREAAPTGSFQIQRPGRTGVSGRMIAGPTCPVVRPGVTCPPARGVRGTVELAAAPSSRSSPGASPVTTVASDSDGNFSTDLAPGDYTLTGRAAGPQPPEGTMSRFEVIHVASGVVSDVTLAFDTGIR